MIGENLKDIYINMDYNNLAEIEQLVYSLPRIIDPSDYPLGDDDFGLFKPIIIDDFTIKLYAGIYFNCFPRGNFNSLRDYSCIEVGISGFDKEYGAALIFPSKDKRFSYFEWAKYFTYGDESPSYLAGAISLNTVFQIIKDVKKIGKLKTFF